jgi:toxin ParE1/3/4
LELRRADGIPRRVHCNYLIFYRIRIDMVEILHVIHGACDYAQIVFANDETE